MTNEELKAEFNRWIEAGRPKVWCKYSHENQWSIKNIPTWNGVETYIVNDEHAEVRKAYHDNPDLEIQWFNISKNKWTDVNNPLWYKGDKYRIKPKPKTERRWRWASDENGCTFVTSTYMTDEFVENHIQYDDWYKLENDYIDVAVKR